MFAFGDATFAGSMVGRPLNGAIVGIAATPTGRGYWLVGADGGVFGFGDAVFASNITGRAGSPVVGVTPTAEGRGYWLANSTGGVFAFGSASFVGSLNASAPRPIVGISAAPGGYGLADQAGQSTFITSGARANRTTLYPGERLDRGQRLTSANGRYMLVMQGDGNLVEYDGGTPVWASNTMRAGSSVGVQGDGNVVVYAPGHVAVWATGSNRPGSVLTLQDDRNLVVYAPGNQPAWSNSLGI